MTNNTPPPTRRAVSNGDLANRLTIVVIIVAIDLILNVIILINQYT